MTAGIGARHVEATFLQHGGKAELSPERLLKGNQTEHVEGGSLWQMITTDLIAEQSAIETEHSVPVHLESNDV